MSTDAMLPKTARARPDGASPGRLKRWIVVYARVALGAAFLSGIADRFGLWGREEGYGDFAGFVRYTAKVNAFMPASAIPVLAWGATAAELVLGVMLVFGVWSRWVALGSALLLALFGIAMAISLGPKSPLDYSVFSASAGALLLAMHDAEKARAARASLERARAGWITPAYHPVPNEVGAELPSHSCRASR